MTERAKVQYMAEKSDTASEMEKWEKERGGFFPVLLEIERRMAKSAEQRKTPVVVGIDGRCGSGKTSIAQIIAEIYPCNVFHMDDFYLPVEKREDNWSHIPGGNIDFDRFRSEVLLPACKGETVYYRSYDCSERSYGDTLTFRNCTLVIVEGSYSHHPLLAGMYDLKIFLTCSGEVQAKRLQEREKSNYSSFKERWIPMEENYFQSCSVEGNSDLIVNTDAIFP